MLKVKKETNLQKQIVDACIKLGGYGAKLQDKFVKGKSDIWLQLPSGLITFHEVKINRNVVFKVSPEFKILQLENMRALVEHGIPTTGLLFAVTPEGYVNFKIAEYMELKSIYEKFNTIAYHINHYKRIHSVEEVIAELEKFYEGSAPQAIIKNKITLTRHNYYADLTEESAPYEP